MTYHPIEIINDEMRSYQRLTGELPTEVRIGKIVALHLCASPNALDFVSQTQLFGSATQSQPQIYAAIKAGAYNIFGVKVALDLAISPTDIVCTGRGVTTHLEPDFEIELARVRPYIPEGFMLVSENTHKALRDFLAENTPTTPKSDNKSDDV